MAKFFKNFLRGENTIIATDLVPHNTGKYSKFFGQECYSLDIIEKLSNKKTHDLYFVYLSPGTTKKYKLNIEYIENPINTDEMNKCFERAILQNPEMYGWEYKKNLRNYLENPGLYINFSKKMEKTRSAPQRAPAFQLSSQMQEYTSPNL